MRKLALRWWCFSILFYKNLRAKYQLFKKLFSLYIYLDVFIKIYVSSYSTWTVAFIFIVTLKCAVLSVCRCLCELGLITFSLFTLLWADTLIRFCKPEWCQGSFIDLWGWASESSFVVAKQPKFHSSKTFRSQGMLCVSACVLVQSSWPFLARSFKK